MRVRTVEASAGVRAFSSTAAQTELERYLFVAMLLPIPPPRRDEHLGWAGFFAFDYARDRTQDL